MNNNDFHIPAPIIPYVPKLAKQKRHTRTETKAPRWKDAFFAENQNEMDGLRCVFAEFRGDWGHV